MFHVRIAPVRLDQAFERIHAAVSSQAFPTAVLAVANRDTLVRCEAFSSPLNQIAIDSVFLLASITKPIVATAVLQLVENGLLDLAQPVGRYLPELAHGDHTRITTWHLLTHTSGIREIDWATTLRQRPMPAVSFDAACSLPLLFVPGSRFEYSTLSFYVLAELITRLSGMRYPQYLMERIFAPLGMHDTSFEPNAARMVPVHGITAGQSVSQEEATDYFLSFQMPGAGLWSTVPDLIKLGQALLNDSIDGEARLLSLPWLDLMTRDHTRDIAKQVNGVAQPVHHGLGWRKGSSDGCWTVPCSPRTFEHDGATGSLLWVDPAWSLIVVFLTNQFGVDTHARNAALQIMYSALRRS